MDFFELEEGTIEIFRVQAVFHVSEISRTMVKMLSIGMLPEEVGSNFASKVRRLLRIASV